jgi:hypothetical protein
VAAGQLWRQDEDGWWLLTLTSDVCGARSTNRKLSMTGELTLKQRFKVQLLHASLTTCATVVSIPWCA